MMFAGCLLSHLQLILSTTVALKILLKINKLIKYIFFNLYTHMSTWQQIYRVNNTESSEA